jgi:hypothetical protein
MLTCCLGNPTCLRRCRVRTGRRHAVEVARHAATDSPPSSYTTLYRSSSRVCPLMIEMTLPKQYGSSCNDSEPARLRAIRCPRIFLRVLSSETACFALDSMLTRAALLPPRGLVGGVSFSASVFDFLDKCSLSRETRFRVFIGSGCFAVMRLLAKSLPPVRSMALDTDVVMVVRQCTGLLKDDGL